MCVFSYANIRRSCSCELDLDVMPHTQNEVSRSELSKVTARTYTHAQTDVRTDKTERIARRLI